MSLTEREIKVAIVAAIIAVVVSVVMLEMKGYIKHLDKDDSSEIGQFTLVLVTPDNERKISSKTSNKEAFCANGFLFIKPEKNKSGNTVSGILIDAKERAIKCRNL